MIVRGTRRGGVSARIASVEPTPWRRGDGNVGRPQRPRAHARDSRSCCCRAIPLASSRSCRARIRSGRRSAVHAGLAPQDVVLGTPIDAVGVAIVGPFDGANGGIGGRGRQQGVRATEPRSTLNGNGDFGANSSASRCRKCERRCARMNAPRSCFPAIVTSTHHRVQREGSVVSPVASAGSIPGGQINMPVDKRGPAGGRHVAHFTET